MSATVTVVGGGVAGTTAALRLARDGWDVTLLESRPRLGGAAYSFTRGDLVVDTGQHVALRCYTAYRWLLRETGADDLVPVQPALDIPVLAPGRRPRHLARTPGLPAPAHLLPAFARYAHLTPGERVRASAAIARLRTLDPDDPDLDARSLGSWLRRHGQSDAAIRRLWALIAVPALNVDVDDASLALAVRVFRTGLLDDPTAGDVAVPAVPLGRIHHDAAATALDRAGVRVRTGERVRRLTPRPEGGYAVATDTGEAGTDAVVVAVPHDRAAHLVPPQAAPERDAWSGLGEAPIVSVHVRYDRPVTQHRFAAVVDSPVTWVFDRTAAAGCEGQYLALPTSAATREQQERSGTLVDRHTAALAALFPPARSARVLDAFVTREPRATFRQAPGTARCRPPARTRLPGLVLAGAWTATGWPDTLEGAARSGQAAASALGAPTTLPARVPARSRHEGVTIA